MKTARWMLYLGVIFGTWSSALPAATILTEDFTGSTGTQPAGWYAHHGSAGGTSPTLVTDTVLGASGNTSLQFNGASGQAAMVGSFSSVTLVNTGDYIDLSLSFRFTTTSAATNDGPLIGFYNSGGTLMTANSLGSVSAEMKNDVGYSVYKIGANSSSDVIFRGETNTSDSNAYKASASTALSTTSSSLAISDTLAHTLGLRIEMAASGNLIITYTLDSFSTTYTTTSVITTTFDEVLLMANGNTAASGRIDMDSLVITTNAIPEPSTYVLLMIGGISFFSLRYFRRNRLAY